MEKNQEPHVIFEQIGHATWLTLNRPQQRNPLSTNMMLALKEALGKAAENDQTRVVVIRANGSVFSAGHDLREISAQEGESEKMHRCRVKKILSNCANLMQSIMKNPKPIIASIQGPATAAGCQLVASCDMAVAGKQTKFGVNGVNIGLFCSTPMVALSRNIPRKLTFEMLTTGEFIDAKKACAIGLINRIASEEKLATETLKLAQVVSEKLSAVVKIGKEAFYNQLEMQVEEAYSYTGMVMAENMGLKDTQEGILAFLEKRTPKWNT